MENLQQLCLPSANLPIDEALYIKGSYIYSFENGDLYINKGEKISFDTYYNSFPLRKWTEKCNLKKLFIDFSGDGKCLVKLYGYNVNGISEYIVEKKIDLSVKSYIDINLTNLKKFNFIYVTVEAISDCSIKNIVHRTTDAKLNDVKLAIVITHYNRCDSIKRTIARMKRNILCDDNIGLFLIDNSNNCCIDSNENITVIPNANYGGSGGFMRGLLEARVKNKYTHCLFMDDDASSEPESIIRCIRFLEFCRDDSVAISGMILKEERPRELHEKGGKYHGTGSPICGGLDLIQNESLNIIESNYESIDYGGWFFFLFPIRHVEHGVFPFFVRGDDIQFGLINNFNIISLMGVATYSGDFGEKDTALTRYLSLRSDLILGLSNGISYRFMILLVVKLYLAQVLSYNYGSARSLIFALNNILKGPEFFVENMGMSNIFRKISDFKSTYNENQNKLICSDYIYDHPRIDETKLRRCLRVLTINGLFFPKIMLKNRMVLQRCDFRASFRQVFRYKSILYYNKSTKHGYVAKYSFIKFIKLSSLLLINLAVFTIRYRKLSKIYKKQIKEKSSLKFWMDLYDVR